MDPENNTVSYTITPVKFSMSLMLVRPVGQIVAPVRSALRILALERSGHESPTNSKSTMWRPVGQIVAWEVACKSKGADRIRAHLCHIKHVSVNGG